ncbi:MAG: DUF4142 domain-containing protein [Sphingobium sp.]
MTYAWKSVALLSALSLAACGANTERAADNAVDATQNALSDTADAAGNVLENAGQALTPTPLPQEFADRAARSDAFEIAAAEIAAKNAASAEVKAFASTMIDAHKQSTDAFKKAAAAASPAITPNAKLTDDQEEDLAELRKLTGAEFDKKYVDEQVDAHEDALDLMKKYAADGEVPSLKIAASDTVAVIERHLAQAKELDTLLDKD